MKYKIVLEVEISKKKIKEVAGENVRPIEYIKNELSWLDQSLNNVTVNLIKKI